MEKSSDALLERDLNRMIASKMREEGFLVLQEVRLQPCELDIVLFDPTSLYLVAIEIKRMNWKRLLDQAVRAKLYSHFAIGVLPSPKGDPTFADEFTSRGIGLMFYDWADGAISLTLSRNPQMSTEINRGFKQVMYRRFHQQYGDLVYA